MAFQNYLTVAEVAEILGVSVQMVRRLIRDEKLVSQRIGRFHLVPRPSITAYKKVRRGRGRPAISAVQ